ncbi:ADP-ribosylation factor 6 [Oopsacas minuta]|uniref:ADP-ribosylation factor 6 n=1 Tax=Oopsacas minuta TaxID=111878 RepID=A0AAV7KKI5_9METZ|nr:ADP-ribosylation factor 6 [Oopsacas minuta]
MGQEISKTDCYQEFTPKYHVPTYGFPTTLCESDQHFIAKILERKSTSGPELEDNYHESNLTPEIRLGLHTTQSAPELQSPTYQRMRSSCQQLYSLTPNRHRLVSSQPDLHLISITPSRKQRILMLGLDGAGKSTLFQRIRETKKGIHTKVPNEPTIAYNVTSLDFDGRPCTLWDVSGSPLTRDLWKHYLSGTDCLVWVVDSSRLCRIQESRNLLHKIVSNRTMRSVPLVVVANKQDLPTARNSLELEELLQLDEIREQGHFVKVITTSATTGKDTRKVLKKFRKVLSKSKSSSFECENGIEAF